MHSANLNKKKSDKESQSVLENVTPRQILGNLSFC